MCIGWIQIFPFSAALVGLLYPLYSVRKQLNALTQNLNGAIKIRSSLATL